jgi:hypothetical protein
MEKKYRSQTDNPLEEFATIGMRNGFGKIGDELKQIREENGFFSLEYLARAAFFELGFVAGATSISFFYPLVAAGLLDARQWLKNITKRSEGSAKDDAKSKRVTKEFVLQEKDGKAELTLRCARLPTLDDGPKTVLFSSPERVIKKMAELAELDDLRVVLEVYGTDDEAIMLEAEHDVRHMFDLAYMKSDGEIEMGKMGKISSILMGAVLATSPVYCESFSILGMGSSYVLPALSPLAYFMYKGAEKNRLRSLKFQECAAEIANSEFKVVAGGDEKIEDDVKEILDYFDSLDGTTLDIYLKMALKGGDADIRGVKKFYTEMFKESRGIKRLGDKFRKFITKNPIKERLKGEEDEVPLSKKLDDPEFLKKPLVKEKKKKRRNILYYQLPNLSGDVEVRSSDLSRGISRLPLARLALEEELETGIDLLVAEKIYIDKEVRSRFKRAVYLDDYFRGRYGIQTIANFTKGWAKNLMHLHPLSFIPYGFVAIGAIFPHVRFFIPLGLANIYFSRKMSNKMYEKFMEWDKGFDKIYHDDMFLRINQVEDKRLQKLQKTLDAHKDKPLKAYNMARLDALEIGLYNIGDEYQKKSMHYQRALLEPKENIIKKGEGKNETV